MTTTVSLVPYAFPEPCHFSSRWSQCPLPLNSGRTLWLLQLIDTIWLLRPGHKRQYSFRLVFSLGMLTLGTQTPCHEEAWATWSRPPGFNQDSRPQPSSSWGVALAADPTALSWAATADAMKQRLVFPIESWPRVQIYEGKIKEDCSCFRPLSSGVSSQ